MSSMLGGDIQALEALGNRLRTESQHVQELQSSLTSLVSGTAWTGPASERFRAAWNGTYSQNLRAISQALQDAATEVQRRKDALVQVSS